MRRFLALALGLVIVLGTLSVAAQTPLTNRLVKSLVSVMPELKALGEKYDQGGAALTPLPPSNPQQPGASPYASSLARMQGHPAYNEMVEVLQRNGFKDLSEFANVADRVIRAYTALKMQQQRPKMDAQMQEAVRQIESSKMSANQKKAMIDMIKQSQQAMTAYGSVSESDKAVVGPHLQSLERAFQ